MCKRIHGAAILLLLIGQSAWGDEPFRFQGESKLPLIILDTSGQPVPNDPKIDANMSIIDGGEGKSNKLSDATTVVSKIRIEVRGSSSQMFDKKSYSFETVDSSGNDKKMSLLGLPRDSDWILYGPFSDKSLMRNFLAYDLSNKIGRYAPRTQFAEVFLRDSKAPVEEQYVGVYLLVESIKRGLNRVNVPQIRKKGDDLTGGYILKIDRVGGPETYFTSDLGTVLGFVSPRGDRLDDEQRQWIQKDFSRIERTMAGRDFLDPKEGYKQFVDIDSFIDYFLVNELFKNVDAYFLSTFLHKPEDGKLHLGPIWDLDLSTGNASYGGVWNTESWMLFPDDPQRAWGRPFWWDRMFEDPAFRTRLLQRWRELRSDQFAESAIVGTIDETARRLESSQRKNFERWPILGNYVWPNPRPYSKSYAEEVSKLKVWFGHRVKWMDENIDALVAKPRRLP